MTLTYERSRRTIMSIFLDSHFDRKLSCEHTNSRPTAVAGPQSNRQNIHQEWIKMWYVCLSWEESCVQ